MRIRTGTALALAAGLTLGLAGHADAQARRVMVIEEDDGGEGGVLNFSLPDFQTLFRPDYQRDDLPLFQKRLKLDGLQHEFVSALLDGYLDKFHGLRGEHLPQVQGGGGIFIGGAGGDIALQMDPLADGAEDDSSLRDAIEEVTGGETPTGTGIEIMITAGGPPTGAGGDAGGVSEGNDISAGVEIALPEGVELTPEQKKKLEAAAQKMAEQIRKRMEEREAAGEGPGGGMPFESLEERRAQMEEMLAAADALAKAKAELKKEFEKGVHELLLPEQDMLWPRLEWALTRQNTLSQGRLPGERTDLYRLLEQLGIDPEAGDLLGEKTESYEMTLHDALTERNEYLEESSKDLDEALAAGKPEKAAAIASKAARLRETVRDTNKRYAGELAELMDDGAAAEFTQRFLERSYPSVYRTTRVERAIEAILRLDDLDDDVRDTVETLQDLYVDELGHANERLAAALDRWEPGAPARMFERMAEAGAGGMVQFGMDDDDSPVSKTRNKRRELGERYLKQLRSLLPAEQRETIQWLQPAKKGPVRIQRVIGGPPGRNDN